MTWMGSWRRSFGNYLTVGGSAAGVAEMSEPNQPECWRYAHASKSSGAVVGAVPNGICLQDRRGPSTACRRVLSLQLASGGPSSQCAPIGPSSGRWNDKQNDTLDRLV